MLSAVSLESDALAINDKGQIVGLSDTGKKTEWFAYRHAVLWTLKR